MAIDPDVQDQLEGVYARLRDLESAPGGGGPVGAAAVEVGDRYVTEDGDDTKDGLSWATAKASPQAAYDDLVENFNDQGHNIMKGRRHIGTVHLGPHSTFYDVGEGLNLDKGAVAGFRGVQASKGQDPYGWMSRLGTTSPTARWLVGMTTGPTNGYGFKFRNLSFYADLDVAASLESMIRGYGASLVTVDDCYADVDNGPFDGFFIKCAGAVENSWWDVTANRVNSMGLIQTVQPTTNNQNRWNVEKNQVFCGNPNLRGQIDIYNVFDSSFIGNNLEGDMTAIYAEKCGSNSFINNSGESSTIEHPAIVMPGGWWNIIIGGRWQTPTSGVFLDRTGGGSPVTVINPQATMTTRTDGAKNRIIDPKGTVTLLGGFGGVTGNPL